MRVLVHANRQEMWRVHVWSLEVLFWIPGGDVIFERSMKSWRHASCEELDIAELRVLVHVSI